MPIPARQPAEKQSGYILATTAILLIPLMVFAAFAVDVGGWYVEADQAQRAADAAALAAVVYLPEEVLAASAAMDVVRENGYPDALLVSTMDPNEARPQVLVEELPNDTVRVTIQAQGQAHFGKVVSLDQIAITRFAAADYNLPVPMGSPYNILGYGVTFDTEPASQVLLAMEGYCNAPGNGDRRGNVFLNENGCGTLPGDTDGAGNPINTYIRGFNWVNANSAGRVVHPLFEDLGNAGTESEGRKGYRFVIDVPDLTGPTTVHIFDAPACNGNGLRGISEGANSGNRNDYILLTFQLWDATATPLDDNDITPIGTMWRPTQPPDNNNIGGTQCNSWAQLPVGALAPGRYYLDVRNDEANRGGFVSGTNFFAIQARENGSSSVVDSRADAASPVVYAREWLPIRAALPQVPAVTSARFQLAEISPDLHDGKTMEITMYDPGEGMEQIQVLDPGGNPLFFTWDTDDGGQFSTYSTGHQGDPFGAGEFNAVQAGCNPAGWCVDVLAAQPKLWNLWGGGTSSRFQGRQLYIRVPLGTGNNAGMTWAPGADPDDHWFEVRYTCVSNAGGCVSVSDVTTWKVRVVGDPVRLTE